MSTSLASRSSRRQTAALMAFYTFLLALGAALPVAASFAPGMEARHQETQIRPGGYQPRREEVAPVAAQEQVGAVGAHLSSSTMDVDLVPHRDGLTDVGLRADLTDSRGS